MLLLGLYSRALPTAPLESVKAPRIWHWDLATRYSVQARSYTVSWLLKFTMQCWHAGRPSGRLESLALVAMHLPLSLPDCCDPCGGSGCMAKLHGMAKPAPADRDSFPSAQACAGQTEPNVVVHSSCRARLMCSVSPSQELHLPGLPQVHLIPRDAVRRVDTQRLSGSAPSDSKQ